MVMPHEMCVMQLEVCVDSLESAINAIRNGADELEICSALPEGGLTPSPGLLNTILGQIHCDVPEPGLSNSTVKVNVMIRCRGGNDFCYTPEEKETMLAEIEFYKTEKRIDRYVFGALTADGEVDRKFCAKVIQKASPTPVTFHRAFDYCRDPITAMQTIVDLGFDRVLTSGQRSSAADIDALILLRDLQRHFTDKITIVPGGGVTVDNVKVLAQAGFDLVHSSCKVKNELPKRKLVDGVSDNTEIFVTDGNIVRHMKRLLPEG